ncbi:hypothetical protein SDC9_205941 [bioreactor metagenome]|uniref:Uncharacterized protein n=1 Tax=bioreactor metagenome TaxID=1076179 RepID=A0A645J3K7_9ZZZZ
MFIIESYRNTPFETCARDAQILKPRFDKVVDHLVYTGLRLKKVGVLLIIFHEPVGVF